MGTVLLYLVWSYLHSLLHMAVDSGPSTLLPSTPTCLLALGLDALVMALNLEGPTGEHFASN